jgi:drug/metabolite transporter (DMT)-like permease
MPAALSSTQDEANSAKAWAAFAAISLIWGSTWLAHKWALKDLTPVGLMSLRLGLAAAFCFAMGRVRREEFPIRAQWHHLALAGLFMTGVVNVATAWSLTQLPSGVGAILQAPIPVWMALFSIRSDPMSKLGWLAVFLGLGGVVLVSWPTGSKDDFDWLACTVCIVAAAVWSWASLYQRKHLTTGGLYTNASLQMTQGAVLGSLLVLGGVPATTGHGISSQAWWAIAYLVGFGSIIAFASYLYLTKVWHPARAGSFSYLNPIVAVLIGWWLANEAITTRMMVGLAIILCAVAVLQYETMRSKTKLAELSST